MDKIFSYVQELHATLDFLPLEKIREVVKILHEARLRERTIFVLGNGGSATTASHFVCDLSKNTRAPNWPHFRVIGLTDNVASITAYGNDEGYETVFAQQLAGLVRSGDIVLAISASGNSPNVLRAVELANDKEAFTIGMTGFSGGKLAGMVNENIHVPSNRIEQVEDIHLMIEHMIVTAVRDATQPISINKDLQLLLGPEVITSDSLADSDGIARNTVQAALERLYSADRDVMSQPELFDLLTHVLQALVGYFSASSGSLLVFDDDGHVKDGVMAYGGLITSKPAIQLTDILKQGLAGWVYRNNQPALVSSTKNDPRWLPRAWEEMVEAPRSAISLPLVEGTRVMGVLTLVRADQDQFTPEDLAQLATAAILLSIRDSAG